MTPQFSKERRSVMNSFSIRKGLAFRYGERILTIVRRLMDGRLQLEADDGELLNCSESELLINCNKGLWLVEQTSVNQPVVIDPKITRDLSTFPKSMQDKIRKREEYLTRITKNKEFVINFIELKKQIALSQVAHSIAYTDLYQSWLR